MNSAVEKRLDKVEAELTPKEWAIRVADAISESDYFSDFISRESDKETNFFKASRKSLREQVEKKFPGKNNDNIKAYNKAMGTALVEFYTLWTLINEINVALTERAEKGGFQAAYNLQVLQTIILQDSFSRTSAKAAEWIELVKAEDAEDEENRQIMLQELATYQFNSPLADTVARPRSLDLGNVRIDFPAAIEEWLKEARSLIFDLYCHRLAVEIIQNKYFDGHSILAKRTVADLKQIIDAVEAAVERHNQYLELRKKLFSAEWEEDESEGFHVGLSGERQGRLELDLINVRPKKHYVEQNLVKQWVEKAKVQARFDLHHWFEAEQ